jgi:sucrose-phosphate synthase
MEGSGLRILSLSVHGLVRARHIELGRDADTGGQIAYVIEQATALAAHPRVANLELMTRRVFGKNLDDIYAEPHEPIVDGAEIVRITCGPRRYLRKERLWPYLDGFTDQVLNYVRRTRHIPDLVHGHYADAGYVGSQVAKLLGVPFIFTGHSLGRVKKQRLLEKGQSAESLEKQLHIGQRIEAEERALENAALIITSTQQEVHEQYEIYEHYVPDRMEVIPPGVDLERFGPPSKEDARPAIAHAIDRFLREPGRPMILAIARPDERKNLGALVRAYGEEPRLRDLANLVILAGTRKDVTEMPKATRRVLRNLLYDIDRYDLYGRVAYPKQHEPNDIPELYKYAARLGGVFVNPALTEPFGLTLVEAAASGLPVVATRDGGAREIVQACENGLVVDPLDTRDIAGAIVRVLGDRERWKTFSQNGLRRSQELYSWAGHAKRYVTCAANLLEGDRPAIAVARARPARIAHVDRFLVTDVDNTLTGDDEALQAFLEELERASPRVGFAIATGRAAEDAVELLSELGVPRPDLLISGVGTEIHYGRDLTPDRSWHRHIDHRWYPDVVRAVLDGVPGLKRQKEGQQTRFKASYILDTRIAPPLRAIRRLLREEGLRVKAILSLGAYLDVLPIRASPGQVIRFLGFKWNLPPERFLVAGDSGNDEEMLRGDTLGVVVGNYSRELEVLRGKPRVHFAEGGNAWGILEGISHYDFFGEIRLPGEEE